MATSEHFVFCPTSRRVPLLALTPPTNARAAAAQRSLLTKKSAPPLRNEYGARPKNRAADVRCGDVCYAAAEEAQKYQQFNGPYHKRIIANVIHSGLQRNHGLCGMLHKEGIQPTGPIFALYCPKELLAYQTSIVPTIFTLQRSAKVNASGCVNAGKSDKLQQ